MRIGWVTDGRMVGQVLALWGWVAVSATLGVACLAGQIAPGAALALELGENALCTELEPLVNTAAGIPASMDAWVCPTAQQFFTAEVAKLTYHAPAADGGGAVVVGVAAQAMVAASDAGAPATRRVLVRDTRQGATHGAVLGSIKVAK
jgi:hypothetical protein